MMTTVWSGVRKGAQASANGGYDKEGQVRCGQRPLGVGRDLGDLGRTLTGDSQEVYGPALLNWSDGFGKFRKLVEGYLMALKR